MRKRFLNIAVRISAPLLVMALSATRLSAAPPTPGTVISPVDKPVLEPASSPAQPVSRAGSEAAPPPALAKPIPVRQFVLSGNTLFDDARLLKEIAGYAGRPLTLAQIYEAADTLQRFYRRQGYLLASVYVPAQKISSGVVRLEIVEGRLSQIRIEGDLQAYHPAFLRSRFEALKQGDIIRRDALEQEVLQLNDLPGLRARAVIVPGETYGSSDIAIKAEENRSSATLRVNNYGRRSLGEGRLEAGWLYANPFRQGDRINLSAVMAQQGRMMYARADYDAPVGAGGMRLGGSISAFNYEVDTQTIGLVGTLEGDGLNARLQWQTPLVRQLRERMDVSVVLRRSETGEAGSLALSTATRAINVLDIGWQWQPRHANGASSDLSLLLSTNFRGNADASRDDAEKARLMLNYIYTQAFSRGWFTRLRGELVFSADPLPDVERYRIGGPASVRAYPAAELAGDEGGLLSLDAGRRLQTGGTTLLVTFFADAGKVKRILPAAGEQAEDSLSGYGAGLVAVMPGGHQLELMLATPAGNRVSSDGRDTRGWLNYTAVF